ncbi:MAG: transcription antitermination factor NusB [Sphingomonadales bacterium]
MAAEQGLASRRAALAVLEAVLGAGQALDTALETVHAATRLDPRDRGLVRQLVATVLRRQGEIDRLIKHCMDRPLAEKALTARLILALGAAQLFYLDIPDHAAIATSVELAARDRRARVRGFKNLINAVLRRLAREGRAWQAQLDHERLALPGWLWRRWCAAYGEAATRATARVISSPPPLDLTPRDAPARAWMLRHMPAAQPLPQGSLRLQDAGPVEALPGYDQGYWWVQDAAAAMPAQLLAPRPGDTVLDLCAAPGGKTLQLAMMGAHVTAIDAAPARLDRLRQNLARVKLDAHCLLADAGQWRPANPVVHILLDAPCSSTGTLRRRPDVALLKRPADIAAMAAVQRRLLAHAASLLAPGGVLVYAVCSLEPEESEQQIAQLLAGQDDLRRLPITESEAPGLAQALTPDGDLRILPGHWQALGGIDGFYIARLTSTA